MTKQLSIGLVAHDAKKQTFVEWVTKHADFFEKHCLFATGTTGGLIQKSNPNFKITCLKSGPLGGDQQLGSLICEDKLDALFFFTDPLTPMPHDVDIKALIRLSTLYNLPFACNPLTADMILSALKLD